MEQEFVELLKNNALAWNEWRRKYPEQTPSLREVNFVNELMKDKKDIYDLPRFYGIDFTNVDLHMSSLRNCFFDECRFDGAKITFADLVDAYFVDCTFKDVNMRVSKIGSATFSSCIFENSDLSYCSAKDTSFEGSKFINTALEHVTFVANNFSDTELIGCSVYGISSWDLNLDNSTQKNLIITKDDQPTITVDNIELAQFIYLMINNTKLRSIIDTLTSKVVLILGNFSPERKIVLDEIREKLRDYDYIPVMFDFEKPSSRNFTETVFTLANMARFVVADLSSVRSIGHELATIVPKLPSVTFYPLIVCGDKEYGMFNDLLEYNWVKPIMTYKPNQVGDILEKIIIDQREDTLK
ncbi:uncharacterized protein YjbI with pentapeptide repeats [Lacrimispora xylanisolvens]|uniref:Uncharacterized protein YjbI with pentapeptide repeats n=1 Tax=Lacrimispora xylanisolvens TaxID=384636 RepID=A0A2S6HTW9_9FIRM|nr:pentapeptide repeat-containing protein [Hungatella xylanolytica]PPK81204.1 uncharacterized protein YjbI with pentapeptide repeats [Hungatella xylanolytica]